MQAQLFCTGLSYCDFVVCTQKEVFIERIKPDTAFMMEKMAKVKDFFEIAVLPELLGRWFSRPTPDTFSSNISISPGISYHS